MRVDAADADVAADEAPPMPTSTSDRVDVAPPKRGGRRAPTARRRGPDGAPSDARPRRADRPASDKQRRDGPDRTCVGCRRTGRAGRLVPARGRPGRHGADRSATAPGRGAWCCSTGCFEQAVAAGSAGPGAAPRVTSTEVEGLRATLMQRESRRNRTGFGHEEDPGLRAGTRARRRQRRGRRALERAQDRREEPLVEHRRAVGRPRPPPGRLQGSAPRGRSPSRSPSPPDARTRAGARADAGAGRRRDAGRRRARTGARARPRARRVVRSSRPPIPRPPAGDLRAHHAASPSARRPGSERPISPITDKPSPASTAPRPRRPRPAERAAAPPVRPVSQTGKPIPPPPAQRPPPPPRVRSVARPGSGGPAPGSGGPGGPARSGGSAAAVADPVAVRRRSVAPGGCAGGGPVAVGGAAVPGGGRGGPGGGGPGGGGGGPGGPRPARWSAAAPAQEASPRPFRARARVAAAHARRMRPSPRARSSSRAASPSRSSRPS